MIKINSLLSSSIAELKQITWPTKKETIRLVIIVTAFSLLMAAFLGLADFGFLALIQKFIIKV